MGHNNHALPHQFKNFYKNSFFKLFLKGDKDKKDKKSTCRINFEINLRGLKIKLFKSKWKKDKINLFDQS